MINKHGGARKGAGRKPAEVGTVQVNWRVSESAKMWIRNISKETGESTAVILDLVIKVYEEAVTKDMNEI